LTPYPASAMISLSQFMWTIYSQQVMMMLPPG
jgi:hypothetical protein